VVGSCRVFSQEHRTDCAEDITSSQAAVKRLCDYRALEATRVVADSPIFWADGLQTCSMSNGNRHHAANWHIAGGRELFYDSRSTR
jgi:hypothetical protein